MSDNGHDNGELENLDMSKRADRLLLQRANREQWPIPDKLRRKLFNKLVEQLDKPMSERELSNLARTFGSFDRLNLDWKQDRDKWALLAAATPDNVTINLTFDSPSDVELTDSLPEATPGDLRG